MRRSRVVCMKRAKRLSGLWRGGGPILKAALKLCCKGVSRDRSQVGPIGTWNFGSIFGAPVSCLAKALKTLVKRKSCPQRGALLTLNCFRGSRGLDDDLFATREQHERSKYDGPESPECDNHPRAYCSPNGSPRALHIIRQARCGVARRRKAADQPQDHNQLKRPKQDQKYPSEDAALALLDSCYRARSISHSIKPKWRAVRSTDRQCAVSALTGIPEFWKVEPSTII